MSFREQLKKEANYTRTLNGAMTHRSTGDGCLDFFAIAGGMRYRTATDQINLFDRAYIETPDLAMKLLFHLRDVRQGMGERKLFRTLLRHVAFMWPESAKKNAQYIAEYGRWDDLLCLLGTPAEAEAIRVIRKQLDEDLLALGRRNAGELGAHISLLAKWLPSCNTSSKRSRRLAKTLYGALEMTEPAYRRMLTALRSQIGLTERYLTRDQLQKISYKAVPASAMLKYRNTFLKKDAGRLLEYLENVKAGSETMHADTLFPYEICRPLFKNRYMDEAELATLDALWNSMSHEVGNRNALSVIDTSGSMYCGTKSLTPALVSQAMGIYCAERCKGIFHNMFITFNEVPTLMELKGQTLRDKLNYLRTAPWGWNTNMEAVFDLILNTAVAAHSKQDEMPDVLYIFSDMEFDDAVEDPDETVYECARKKFARHGYTMPTVVFHNVNSWQTQTPVTAYTRGTALTSGASVNSLKESFDGNVTPMSHMLRVLNGKRYEVITA